MRSTIRIFALGLLATSALAGLPRDAAATNGMNPICYGTDNCGMGGAGIAVTGNAAGAILNPALSGRAGRELLISAGWLHADVTGQVKGTTNGNNTATPQDSEASDFPDGTLAINWKHNDQWAFNFSAFPGGGGATDWPHRRTGAGFGNNGGHDHQIRTRYFFFEPSVSYTPPQDKNWSFGLGVIISYQDMKTDSLGHGAAQLSAANKQQTDSAMGAGFHLGVFWQPDPILSLGATYRSRVWSERYEKYRLARTFQGPMDMPPQWGVGLAIKPPPVPKLTLAGDVKHIAWQSVKSIGGKEPADGGFGWHNQFVFAVGAAYDVTDKLTGRIGYNYGKSPIDEEHLFANFLFPAISEHHITVGASYKLTPTWELGSSAFWSPENTVTNNPAGSDSYAQSGGRSFVSMEQYGAQISAKMKF
jgi:long-chain fatty acid transport protein